MAKRCARWVLIGVVMTFVVVGHSPKADAHPLGNFTTNRYSGLVVGPGYGTLDYVVDFAELPTFQQRRQIDTNGDGHDGADELAAFAAAQCATWSTNLRLTIDGQAANLRVGHAAASTAPGQGLPTSRVECSYRWSGVPSSAGLRYFDRNFADRIGWREITATGDRTTLTKSDVASRSISARLTNYPKNQLHSPSATTEAQLQYEPGGGASVIERANPIVAHYDGLTHWFTQSVQTRRFSLGLALLAAAVALILGAFHALYPGHGKTVMAAYLVGQRGSTRQGMMLGVTVAVTHTIGVLVLGLILTTTQTFAPERVYPWLGAASGAVFVALGVVLLARAIRRPAGERFVHGHSHGPDGHSHESGGHTHEHVDSQRDGHKTHTVKAHVHAAHGHESHVHAHDTHRHAARGQHVQAHSAHGHHHAEPRDRELSRRSLMTMGFAGGMVPTPSAVVVLLGATTIGRAWFGVLLVAIYGVGMAATLIGAGLALAWARQRFEIDRASERAMRLAAFLPSITGVVVMLGGLVLIARAISGS